MNTIPALSQSSRRTRASLQGVCIAVRLPMILCYLPLKRLHSFFCSCKISIFILQVFLWLCVPAQSLVFGCPSASARHWLNEEAVGGSSRSWAFSLAGLDSTKASLALLPPGPAKRSPAMWRSCLFPPLSPVFRAAGLHRAFLPRGLLHLETLHLGARLKGKFFNWIVRASSACAGTPFHLVKGKQIFSCSLWFWRLSIKKKMKTMMIYRFLRQKQSKTKQ